MNINQVTKHYNQGDLSGVFVDIANMNSSDRIDFEKWLLDRFSPDKALDSDFEMHGRIIEQLCITTREDATSTPDTKKQEDLLIAKLISKATPEEKKGKKDALSQIAHFVHRSAGMVLDPVPIYLAIKDASLPHTSTILLKRLLEHKTLEAIFDQAVKDNNRIMVKTILHQMPLEFSNLLLRQNEKGSTFLHNPAMLEDLALLREIVDKVPKEKLVAVLEVRDKDGNTPFHIVASKNNIQAAKLLIDSAPEALMIRNKGRENPLHVATVKNHALIAAAIIAASPKLVSLPDMIGQTPLHYAVATDNLHLVLTMQQLAPQEFKKAVQSEDFIGATPAFDAVKLKNMGIMKVILAEDPEALTRGRTTRFTAYSTIKSMRLKEFSEITKQYVQDPHLKQLHKACVERVSLSHAWHIGGQSPITIAGKEQPQFHIDLEGHHAPEWLHKMEKELDPFADIYPDLLTKKQLSLMKQLFNLGANPEAYSKDAIVHRIRNGLPVLINSGFAGHATTLLIWGNRLVICNRGGARDEQSKFIISIGESSM